MTIDTRTNNEEHKRRILRFFTKSRKRIAVSAAAVVLVTALIAAACGNGDEGGGHEGRGEGAGEHSGGGEGTGEHSGDGEGAGHEEGEESGEETSPSKPVSQPASGTFNNLDYRTAYDRSANSFMTTVTNNTNQPVCSSRVEVHAAAQGQVTELGPTIGVDLAPGESIDVVLSADPVVPDTYSIHPESSPCP